MLLIAIDGACRRNGKPDCVAAGGVFVQMLDTDLKLVKTDLLSSYEVKSTNQRGELLALLSALDHIYSASQSAHIITDSEYLFNTMTKEWYKNWSNKGWKTAVGEPVKNKDLWLEIIRAYYKCVALGVEVTFYHIKGHCISFGKVTAASLLASDRTGFTLMAEVLLKYDSVYNSSKKDLLAQANELSERNNGFLLTPDKLREFVVSNLVADAVATGCVEAADALMS